MTDDRPDERSPERDEGDDFSRAWEHGEDHDVGADTSEFEAYRADDTGELLRRHVRDGDVSDEELRDATEPGGYGPASSGPATSVILGVIAVVFVVVAVLYLIN